MKEMLNELLKMEMTNQIGSNTPGKRNYLIATEIINGELNIRYAGTKKGGEMFETCWVSDIVKYHYRWFYFTYKKDYEEALTVLKTLRNN